MTGGDVAVVLVAAGGFITVTVAAALTVWREVRNVRTEARADSAAAVAASTAAVKAAEATAATVNETHTAVNARYSALELELAKVREILTEHGIPVPRPEPPA